MRTFKQNHKAFLLIGLMIFSIYAPVFSASKTHYDGPNQPTNPMVEYPNESFFSDNLTIPKTIQSTQQNFTLLHYGTMKSIMELTSILTGVTHLQEGQQIEHHLYHIQEI